MLTFREHGEERAETTSREDFVGTVRAFVRVHGTACIPYVSVARTVRACLGGSELRAQRLRWHHLISSVTVTVFLQYITLTSA